MKKAIANLSFSDLKVRYFTGRSILISDTGQGKRYQYRNGCMTALGDLEISEWREMITELIAYRSEQELQKQLYACLCDAASINLLIADWYRFDSDLRHAMEGMRRYYEKREVIGNENKAVSDRS